MNSRTQSASSGPERDLAEVADELEAELARLKARLEELEAADGRPVGPSSSAVAVTPATHLTQPATHLTQIAPAVPDASAAPAPRPAHRVEILAVESGPITDAASALPPTVRFRVQRTKGRSRRRRGRLSAAARIIAGSGFVIALCIQPAGSVSLWNQSQAPSLYAPVRQNWKVGDIITVHIDEATTADHRWKAEREKDVSINGGAAAEGAGAGRVNLLGLFFPFMNASYESEVKSDNISDRSLTLRATLSAEVVNVLPNGNLQILAKKVTRVNSEEQLVELTGNVRPDDISSTNTVSSAYLADAQIKVNGTLRYTNDARPGILERIASFLSGLFL